VLTGCVACNRWGKPDDENLVMELIDEDYEALRKFILILPSTGSSNLGWLLGLELVCNGASSTSRLGKKMP